MAISKQYLKSKPVCKVTFSIDAKDAKEVCVAGCFNKWSTESTPLKKLKGGTFKGSLNLDINDSYEFKYVVDGEYINEPEADAYKWSDYASSENSVIEL